MSRPFATAIGLIAIALWSLLALLTVWTAPVPPLLLNALTFAVGGAVGLVWVAATTGFAALRAVPLAVYAFGTLGLFGYHLLYFSALRLAPPAEAGLIAYLWPLLIVLLSGLLPGERLRAGHVLGAVISFAGAALLLTRGGAAYDAGALPGYLLALACAVTWAMYSVISRRFGATPTSSVAVFCIASAVLSGLAHLVWETAIWPTDPRGWLAIAGLGLGPVGLAFFVWDVGVKKGDIQVLGVASYAAPLLSTLILVVAGIVAPSVTLALATFLIASGAGLAAWASTRDR